MIPASPPVSLSNKQRAAAPMPTRTYRLDVDRKRIAGEVTGATAITQMIYKTLSTERYAWLIYNWNFGIELEQYIGMPFAYVNADLERVVTEALLTDTRVLEIKNFQTKQVATDALYAEFIAVTTEGNIQIMWEVPLP